MFKTCTLKDRFGGLDHRVDIKEAPTRRESERNLILSKKKADTESDIEQNE